MQVVVLANEIQKAEIAAVEANGLIWIKDEVEFLKYASADAFIDLGYVNTDGRNNLLRQLLPKPVLINSVANTLEETDISFTRINAWHTFLVSPVLEAACKTEAIKAQATKALSLLHKTPEWLSDSPGFITARVVSMIINEAYLALAEGVSTKEEINTAMKLGTAYPFGPFEWAQKIGFQNIVALLKRLSQDEPHYTPADLLVQEGGSISPPRTVHPTG